MNQKHSAPLLAVVSHIIKAAGEKGITMGDLSNEIKVHHPQWKPTSASPAVSNLTWLGCTRESRDYGTRKIFHVRDYDVNKDRAKISKRTAEQALKLKSTNGTKEGLNLLIAIGKDQTTTLSFSEAKELYEQLHQIFGRRE